MNGPSHELTIVFFGSGPFAVPALERLASLQAGENGVSWQLPLVVSRPERRSGRGRKPKPTEVALRAQELGLKVETPQSANEASFLDRLEELRADLFIISDYGEFLGRRFRALPRIGAYNLHASLLPKYRGAAPVARAVLDGERTTGVTLFRIVKEMDAGPIVGSVAIDVADEETAQELENRLAGEAAALLERCLPRFAQGSCEETIQDEALASHAPKLDKKEGEIDWSESAQAVVRRIRAMTPWPGAFSYLERQGQRLERFRFLRARVADGAEAGAESLAGDVIAVTENGFSVLCGHGAVGILELQRAGKSSLAAREFLRGFPLTPGDRFVGDEP